MSVFKPNSHERSCAWGRFPGVLFQIGVDVLWYCFIQLLELCIKFSFALIRGLGGISSWHLFLKHTGSCTLIWVCLR